MSETYRQLRERQQKEFNNFEGMGACIAPQFERGFMDKLGIKSMDEATHIGWGMFCRNDRLNDYRDMAKRHHKELDEAIASDKTGEGFVKGMFYYELANHEAQITGDPTDALAALGYTMKTVVEDKVLHHGYNLAVKKLLGVEY